MIKETIIDVGENLENLGVHYIILQYIELIGTLILVIILLYGTYKLFNDMIRNG